MQSNYWTERAIREKKKALRIAASGNKRMQKQLKATASQINNDIQLFYKKYAQDAGISIAAAKTYLTNKEAGLSYQEYLGLVTEALKGSEHADALLNANLAKQRITRLDALCRQITGRLAVLGGKLENEIGGALLEVGTFEALPYKTLEKLLITDGRWSKRVWGHVEKLDETINKALRDGIAAGASSDVIAKRVQARTGVAMSRCRTLVHTECCYVTESATLDRYIAADVKQYGYLATLDKKTCSGFGGHSCGALDGQVFDVRDAQVGVNYPPMHPNCRCTTYAVFDDGSDEEADFYRIARDENGKNYRVSAKTTYREWKSVAKADEGGIIKSGARITDPESKRGQAFAKSFYAEVRRRTTDSAKIAENLGKSKDEIQKVKDYLFVDKSLYDEDLQVWRRFDEDCMIAHSWQRLTDGKNIMPHDRTLIEHELYEIKLKAENPTITHYEAHAIAQSKYNYKKEAEEYYDNLN